MIRLFVQTDLKLGFSVPLNEGQVHYLYHVMRQSQGDEVLLFNGKDGEWRGRIESLSKKDCQVELLECTRLQDSEHLSDMWLCCAMIKKDRMDWIIEKATELGVRQIYPILTRRTQVSKLSVQKAVLRAIEAAEQSERLSVPVINEAMTLSEFLNQFPADRTLYYLHERDGDDALKCADRVAFLVGPEGGFDNQEFEKMQACPHARAIHFGRLILRAETACLAALSVWNQIQGWNEK